MAKLQQLSDFQLEQLQEIIDYDLLEVIEQISEVSIVLHYIPDEMLSTEIKEDIVLSTGLVKNFLCSLQ